MATKAPKWVMPETLPSTREPTVTGPPAPLLEGWTGTTGACSSGAVEDSITSAVSTAAEGASPMPEICQPPPELVPGIGVRHVLNHRFRGSGCGRLGTAHEVDPLVALRVAVQPCFFFRARTGAHH